MIVTVCNCCHECCCQNNEPDTKTANMDIAVKNGQTGSVDTELQKLLQMQIDTDATKSILIKMNPELCRYLKCSQRKIVEVKKEQPVVRKDQKYAVTVIKKQDGVKETRTPKRMKIEQIQQDNRQPRSDYKIGFYREYQRMPRYGRQVIRCQVPEAPPRSPIAMHQDIKAIKQQEIGINTDAITNRTAKVIELRNFQVQTEFKESQQKKVKRQKTEESQERQTRKKNNEPKEIRQSEPTRYPKPTETEFKRQTPKPPKPIKKPPTPPPPIPASREVTPPRQPPQEIIQKPEPIQHHFCSNCDHHRCQNMRNLKMEIFNKAQQDPRLAERLVCAARSNNLYRNYGYEVEGMNPCTCPHPNCGHYYCLPRHELNPKNYSCQESYCISRIPYAGVGRLNCPINQHYNCYK